MADEILKIFIDHKLHDGEGNLKKGPTLIFFLKRAWPATPIWADKIFWKKFSSSPEISRSSEEIQKPFSSELL